MLDALHRIVGADFQRIKLIMPEVPRSAGSHVSLSRCSPGPGGTDVRNLGEPQASAYSGRTNRIRVN